MFDKMKKEKKEENDQSANYRWLEIRVLDIYSGVRKWWVRFILSYLKHPLRKPRLLRQLLEVLRVRILIYSKIILHRPQLMVLEARSHPLRPLALMHRPR